jgi:hypothetical protein
VNREVARQNDIQALDRAGFGGQNVARPQVHEVPAGGEPLQFLPGSGRQQAMLGQAIDDAGLRLPSHEVIGV